MAVGRVFKEPVLQEIATRNGRSISQIVLRWLLQQPQVVALTRTGRLERIPENLNVFDFTLGEDDMHRISALHEPGSRIVNPSHLAPDWD